MSITSSEYEIQSILQGLNSPEAKHREAVARRIGQQLINDERVVNELQELAASDPKNYVREAAANSLRILGVMVPAPRTPVAEEKHFPRVWVGLQIAYGLLLLPWVMLAFASMFACDSPGSASCQRLQSAILLMLVYPLGYIFCFIVGGYYIYRGRTRVALVLSVLPIAFALIACSAFAWLASK